MQKMIDRAKELLNDGTVTRVLGWKAGEFYYDPTPAYFNSAEEVEELVYDSFCAPNLSKYLVEGTLKEGKILVFMKPCDSYSLNQLLTEHRVKRENIHVIGIGCHGKLDIEKIRAKGVKGIKSIEENGDELTVKTIYGDKKLDRKDVLLDKCLCCKGKKHRIADELIDPNPEEEWEASDVNRFELVEKLEKMSPKERFEFWQGELSKCIRCNACRNICPACTCVKCVFGNEKYDVNIKANSDSFEEKLFHIIRAYHVAGRCTDCGECSRVCPQGIPLQLLNRKFIKDINTFYGEFQAGAEEGVASPLISYQLDDVEPSVVGNK